MTSISDSHRASISVSHSVHRSAASLAAAACVWIICGTSAEADNTQEAKSLLNAGIISINAGDYQKALVDLKKSSELNGKDKEVWYHLATTYNVLGRKKESLESIDQAITLAPRDLELILQRAEFKVFHGDTRSAMKDFNSVLARNATSRRALYGVAMIDTQTLQPAKAMQAYMRLASSSERDIYYYRALGLVHLLKGELTQASGVLLEGERRFPLDPIMRHFRSQSLSALGQFKELIREESFVLKKVPSYQPGLALRGGAYLMTGEPEKAQADLKSAVALDPNDLSSQRMLLLCSHQLDDVPTKERTIQQLRLVAKTLNDDKQLVEIANIERQAGYGKDALECLKKAFQLRKSRGTLGSDSLKELTSAARLSAELQKPKEAIEFYKLAIAVKKNDSTLLTELGRLYFQQKQMAEAEQCIKNALETIDLPRRPKVLNMLATVYRAQNKKDLALKVEQEAHKLTKKIYDQ